MRHHVHRTDAQHGPVHIKAMKHVIHIMFFMLFIKENFFFPVLFQVFAGCDQKARGTTGRVTDHIIRLWCHHIYHHADDVSWRAELSVHPSRSQLGQQIFIDITARISLFELRHLCINLIHRRHDLLQHQWCRDLEDGIPHIFGIGAFLVAMQTFDKWEHPLLQYAVELRCRKIMEHAPFHLAASNLALTNLYFLGKDALIRDAKHCAFFAAQIIHIIQVPDEHQIGHLFDNIQRIRQPACPKDFP